MSCPASDVTQNKQCRHATLKRAPFPTFGSPKEAPSVQRSGRSNFFSPTIQSGSHQCSDLVLGQSANSSAEEAGVGVRLHKYSKVSSLWMPAAGVTRPVSGVGVAGVVAALAGGDGMALPAPKAALRCRLQQATDSGQVLQEAPKSNQVSAAQ